MKIITYNVWYGFQDGEHQWLHCYYFGQDRKDGIYEWLQDNQLVNH